MKLKRFNEAENYDLSFDGFKEVMSDITDDISFNYEFSDNSNSTNPSDDRYYELTIHLPELPYIETTDILGYSHLNIIEHPDNGGGSSLSNNLISRCLDDIGSRNSSLSEVKHRIDAQIENNNLIGNLLSEALKVKSRLSSFDNFKDSIIGFDNSIINITFEIK